METSMHLIRSIYVIEKPEPVNLSDCGERKAIRCVYLPGQHYFRKIK